MTLYPIQLYRRLKLNELNYNVMVLVDGKRGKHDVIPVGRPVQLALFTDNTIKHTIDIEGVFDFEINTIDLYEKCEEISDWLENQL